MISSWLLDLTAMALAENPRLSEYEDYVQDSGEGRWTIQAAIDEAVPVDVLSAALFVRFRPRQKHAFAGKGFFRRWGRNSAGTSSPDQLQ